MNNNGIKFKFYRDSNEDKSLETTLKKIAKALDIQFDKDLNPQSKDMSPAYSIKDISDCSDDQIEEITDSFFDFNFDSTANAPLYKFLVLKNDNNDNKDSNKENKENNKGNNNENNRDTKKYTILANIHPSIFDYSSIAPLCNIFNNSTDKSIYNINENDLKNDSLENKIISQQNNLKNYLNSSDFEEDRGYWNQCKSNINDYIKYYAIDLDNSLDPNKYKKLEIPLTEATNNFLKQYDVSKFDFISAIFSLYLSRVDRTKGCLLKTVISCTEDEFDKNSLLKIKYDGESSFIDYLNEIKNEYDLSIQHTKADIENYMGENLTSYSINDFTKLDGVSVINGECNALTLNVYENSIDLIYNKDLFSDVYMEHMAGNISALISDALDDPHKQCREMNILSNKEKELVSQFSKGDHTDMDLNKTFATAFRENAIRYPDAIAIDDGLVQITYKKMESSSNSIAYDLSNNYNIGLGERVGLMLPRNYHFPELVLALNKIGAAFIPIDADYPLKRIEHMLNIGESKHIITTKEFAKLHNFNVNVICIEELNPNLDVEVDIMGGGDDLFSIMFTSGTTGLPKGVMVSNKVVSGVGASLRSIYDSAPGDVSGCYNSFSFGASFRIYFALYFGETCRIFNDEERNDSLLFIQALKDQALNDLILPPAVGLSIFENERDINLKYMLFTGAKLEKLPKSFNGPQLINLYGTTETSMAIAGYLNPKDEKVTIGGPIDNTWTYILDENKNQVPIRVPGHLYVSRGFLTSGYYKRPDLSEKVFIENPHSDCDENRTMYSTGDLAYYNFDGEIEIMGRDDNQLSVRGFRIESDEILRIMNGFDSISEICLDVENDTLTAYYTISDDLDIDNVKNALKEELPPYMLPTLFVELDEIPLNANGKIDKAALKRTSQRNEDVEINDETLRCVVDAFKDVLKRDSVLIDDDFVALGGNSLSAMQLQLILRDGLEVSLSSNEIIELSTPLNITNHIKSDLVTSSAYELEYTFDEGCPLSESQMNVYLDEQVNDMGTGYNNSFKIDFDENYSIDEIRNALDKLFEAYPILKARIITGQNTMPRCAFDAEVEIVEGTLDDIEGFVRPFELNEYLSRFLIARDVGNDKDVGNGRDLSTCLCMDIHHLIFDGTSLNIILNRLFSILKGEDIDRVDDGILRQISFEENLSSKYMGDAKEFLDEMLADSDEVYDLIPTAESDGEGEYDDSFEIDKESLSLFLQNNSLTANQFYASVFAYTLSRFTGSSKVSFNLIVDGRGHVDLRESVGMFVKTLPLLIDCKNQSIDSYLDYTSGLINSSMKYDLYPFYVLTSEYDLNTSVFFQYSHDIFKNNVCSLRHDLQRDFSFYIFDLDDGELGIKILHSDKFSIKFLKSFVESYELILNGIINVDCLSEINYTTSSDLELLDSYNETEAILKYDDILDAFNDNLSRHPDKDLVSYNDKSYTYSQGAFIANEIANSLIDLGAKEQDHVAFLVERSELYMFNILGILSVGAVYVPLDDVPPDDRIQFILEDTDSRIIIVSDATLERARNLSKELPQDLTFLNISDILKGEGGNLSALPTLYGELACILYTSGTTGVPKGVKITRKAIINFTEFYIKKYGLSENDVFALFASIGFDVSMEGILSSIRAGACLNVIPNDIKLDMNAMNKHFIEHDVSYTHLPAQVAKLFISQNEDISLKVLCTGGEKLGEIEIEHDYRFVDSYGPTETFVDVTSIDVDSKVDHSSIGHLFDNIKAYVLDDELRRVPIGALGELYLAGYQVAKGYLNREEETKKAFLKNPFGDGEDYNVLYRTGDLVRFLPDGSLGIVGRRDRQVKIRGNRLELSEVESVMRSMDIIEDLTVQTVKNGTNKELVAYVVTSREIDNLNDYVSDYIKERKPEYMIPSFIIPLDQIPLNINGKVDKRALPEVDLNSLLADYVAPTTETEKIIVEAFEKVFNQEKIGIYDDFLRLGGDSLTAIKLLSHLKDYNITGTDILTLHTPYAIAKNIKKTEFDLNIYSLESGCPLNESQLNVYLDIVANDKFDAYLIPISLEISKRYDTESISKALCEMANVHPILGMCVSNENEVPYLVKGSGPKIIMESSMDESIAVDDHIKNFLTEPFDLHENLCRFLIIESDDNNRLFAVFHHLIFDALSDGVFKQDLELILDGKSVDLDDSFLRVSAFNQEIQKTDEYDRANDFYDAMLADIDEAGILLDSILADGPGTIETDLDLDKDSIREFLNKHQISESILFTSVFAYTLSGFVGSDKVLFSIVENGRDKFNNFNSIGMYVNTLPLLVDCKNRDVSSFMEDLSGMIYDVIRYNYYPFRLLANKYDIDSNIQFQFMPEWISDGSNIHSIHIDKEILSDMESLIADLNADVVERENRYHLNINYSNRYSSDFINRFAKSYKLILHDILKVTELSKINFICQEDIELLDGYNNTEHPLKYDDIIDAFNDNLSKYPDNDLVYYNDASYTYGEGAYIAKVLKDELEGLGVKSQDKVAFLVERSQHYMLSVLGILSLGAVYVPLDDAHPDDRIQFILEDTEAKVLIVSDETIERGENLADDATLLNISKIIQDEVGTLSHLPTEYGKLACILYTSGTTGIPKGVKITRKSVLNLSESYIRKYNLSKDDVYALFASIGFDVAMKAIFPSICAGAPLAIIPNDIKLDMNAMNNYFIKHNVTHTEISTQVAKLFISQVDETPLKVLTTGGEKLGDSEINVDYRFVDSYGPTEACVDVTSIDLEDKIDYSSIGFLLDNIKGYVLDDALRRLPIGAVGELYLAGNQVADGYLNRDEETEKAFLDNPFDKREDYRVMYASGDMVRVLPDGSLGIVGRRDSQVKIRGNRVELSEIEAVIREIEYIDDLTVQTIKHDTNNELVAYVVVSKDIGEDELKDDISAYVGERKPEYMIPSFVMELDKIPLNVNGKVDKRALPEVNLDSLYADYVAPANETEKAIVKAFETVFDQDKIGTYDDFVRLGGDSITAIRLISLLQKDNIYVTARDILNNKTPYLIAQNIAQDFEEVSYDSVEGMVELLPIQDYFFEEINRDNYTQDFILRANRKLDLNILQSAIDELRNQHDMLRAVYRFDENNAPVQEILPLDTNTCTVNEFVIQDNLEESIEDILENSIDSMDMGSKVMDVDLIHYNDESYIIITLHHLIVDGVSWNILINDLTSLYTQIEDGDEIKYKKAYPYKNWVGDVKGLVENISEEEREKWIEINESIDESNIKGEKTRFEFNVDNDYDIDNLLMLSEEEYWVLALSRAYKKTYGEEVIFERESYGRDESLANLSGTVGWFTSQYPIKIDVSEGCDSVSLMTDVYNVKTAIKDVKHLGLNYASLIYTTKELEYKHCPMTFNFLSSEFTFKNELFESYPLSSSQEMKIGATEEETYGVSFNVANQDEHYYIRGDYAEGTYISAKFNELLENLKRELDFIGNYTFEDDEFVCCLSEPQLGVYLDEKVHDKGTAYASPGVIDCGGEYSVDEVKEAIHTLIDKHPILKGRIMETTDMPLLVCDAEPPIEFIDAKESKLEGIIDNETEKLFDLERLLAMDNEFIKPFDFEESLIRFFIIDGPKGIEIFYDMHHMISDATTSSIMDNELHLALSGKLDEKVDYGFLYASCDSFESQFGLEYENAKRFFDEKFADIDEVQNLPEDIEGSIGKVGLPIHGVREAVEAYAHEKGITVSNFLNAVFAYTYSRFTGSDKVYYNFTEHGRHEEYSQEAISMFVRTIPIMVDCENKSIDEYLLNVSDLILDSMTNNIYPFRLLAKEYSLNIDITFEYNYDLNDMSDVGDEISFYEVGDRVAELLCVVNDLEDGYYVGISHMDKYSQETITRFVYVFKEVLIQFLEKENLGDIDYVSNEDLEILDKINETDHTIKYDDILDAFNDHLSKCPDNKLVSYNDISYTYGEGAYIADKIAKRLIALGVKPQDNVAFLTECREYYMFSVLAILSIGGVYVPLDHAHPDERIEFMISDSDSSVLIASDETYERAKNLANDIVIINISDTLKEDIGTLSQLPTVWGDLSCILYTSGTTGLPKGVKVTRKSSLNISAYHADAYHLTNDDTYGLYSSIGFDGASLGILTTIYAGACLSVTPNDIRLDMHRLNDYFIKQGVTHTFITTQVGKLFAQSIDETSLEVLIVGGEKLGDFKSPENYEFADIYGPTEAFAFVSTIENSKKIHSSSVGNLVYNTKAYILDKEKRKVPVGAVGELYLAGHQVAEGYLNRPEEKAFMDNPFDDGEYGWAYRTGDMVRLLPDGTLGIIGRLDGQVKIRGNRVELSEIEAVIREMDNVEDVTVKTIKNGTNNELVAYVVSDELEGDALKDAVCKHVGESKPIYMAPSYVVGLEEIPLNVNGKVDKRKLPEVTIESKEYEAPKNHIEKAIANAFSEVLKVNKAISRNDEFTVLGGDSIAVITLITKLREGNIQVSVKDVLENQSVKNIAENVEYKLSIVNVPQDTFEGFVDPTPTTRYFWDLDLKNPSYFNVSFLLESYKKIDRDVLEKAMWTIVNHHDSLRAKVKDEKLFVRPQNEEGVFTIEYCNPSDYYNETLRINEGIDIVNGPLIKLGIFEENDYDNLFVCIHHLLVDKDSLRIIINDLNLAYRQISKGEEANLLNKTSSYQDYAFAVEKYGHKEELLKQKDYWENTISSLKNIPHTEIDSNVRKWGLLSFTLPRVVSPILFTNAPKYYDCSVEGLLLAMIAKSWNETMGEDELSVQLNEEGHENFDEDILTERTVGWFNTTYPLILKCEGKDDEIITDTKAILDNVPQNGFGYPIIMGIDTKEIPLLSFEYLLEYNLATGGKMFNSKHRPDLANSIAPENRIGCDISIKGYTINNETFFRFEYNSERFTKEDMERLGDALLININKLLSFTSKDYSDDMYIFSNHPDKKKLFFIHSANFGSEHFYNLGEQIKDDYSFIVIEPYNRNHKEHQMKSIEDYARNYIEMIKTIQPEGPYYLGGYCFGGIIAHEMAIQLERQNEKVEKIITLEPFYIEDEELRKLAIEDQILFAREFLQDGTLNSKHEHIEDMISYALSCISMMYNYTPPYFDGDVLYFKATRESEGFKTEASAKLDEYFQNKKAGGYETCYNGEKLRIIEIDEEHDHLLNIESLKILIPEMKKFIEDSDENS